jgi:quinol monooxygenase YgiN
MTQLRAIVSVCYPTEKEALEELERLKEFMPRTLKHRGCIEWELFHSTTDPRKVVLLEVFDSLDSYDEHHRSRVEGRKNATLPPLSDHWLKGMREGTSVEFYRRELYKLTDEHVWVATDEVKRSNAIRFA